jgi:hypothetical protein
LKIKRGLLFEREEHRERERTRKRLNDDLIGFVRDNEQTKTNNCGEKEFFFEFFSFFFSICFIIFSTKGLLKNQPTERERERERNDDDADFVNPDFKNDDSDDEKNERERSSK